MIEVKRTGRRRVSTAAAPGSDPTPQALPNGTPVRATEDEDDTWGSIPSPRPTGASTENDARLKADKPPHW